MLDGMELRGRDVRIGAQSREGIPGDRDEGEDEEARGNEHRDAVEKSPNDVGEHVLGADDRRRHASRLEDLCAVRGERRAERRGRATELLADDTRQVRLVGEAELRSEAREAVVSLG